MGPVGSAGPSSADLLAVLDVARALAASPELQPLLERVEEATLRLLDCERAGVFLLDERGGELVGRVATGHPGLRFPSDRGIAGAALRSGEAVRIDDAYDDPRFNPEVDRATGFRTRSLLTVPLRGWDDRPLGVLQALNRRGRPFDAGDEALAAALAVQVGVAVQRQVLLDQVEHRARMERDLDLARRIQQGLMPRRPPRLAGFDVAGWNRPADATGGDYFDLQALDDGGLALTVADVAGHGIGPALIVAECRALERATLETERDPARVIERVDRLISGDLPEDRFVTLFLGVLAPDGRLAYGSAGHGPALLYRADDGSVEELLPQGCPLGVAPEIERADSAVIFLRPGDMLAVFTDGFSEWADASGRQFGNDRLGASLARGRDLPAAGLIAAIHGDLLAFTGGTPQPDDLTAVVVKRA